LQQGPNPHRQLTMMTEMIDSYEFSRVSNNLHLALFSQCDSTERLTALESVKNMFQHKIWESDGSKMDDGSHLIGQILQLWRNTLQQQRNPSEAIIAEQLYHGLLQRSPVIPYSKIFLTESFIPESRFPFYDDFLLKAKEIIFPREDSPKFFTEASMSQEWDKYFLKASSFKKTSATQQDNQLRWTSLLQERYPVANEVLDRLAEYHSRETHINSKCLPSVSLNTTENLYSKLLQYWVDPKKFCQKNYLMSLKNLLG